MCCQPVLWVNASVYSDEIFEPKWRLLKIAFNGFVFSAFGFGLIVYFNRTWTGIHFCCSIVSAVTMLFWFLVPESPRWLAQNGEDDKAMKGNLQFWKINMDHLLNKPYVNEVTLRGQNPPLKCC